MSSFKIAVAMVLLVLMAGCGDNLLPSGDDKRPEVQAGSTGSGVSQKAPDFSVSDINGASVTLASSLTGRRGVVFYFTMWCPLCDSHMSHMQASIVPQFPGAGFYLVDYVAGSVVNAASAATASGYAGGVFTVLADTGHLLLNNFQGTMGTTVVVDNNGIVRMNEDYKDGTRLQSVLSALP